MGFETELGGGSLRMPRDFLTFLLLILLFVVNCGIELTASFWEVLCREGAKDMFSVVKISDAFFPDEVLFLQYNHSATY
jgi:hypothetical protein